MDLVRPSTALLIPRASRGARRPAMLATRRRRRRTEDGGGEDGRKGWRERGCEDVKEMRRSLTKFVEKKCEGGNFRRLTKI